MELIRPGRRVGNTTRLIDRYIQQLFDDGYVVVSDHRHDEQETLDRSNQLVYIMLRRLNLEHGIDCAKSINKKVVCQSSIMLLWN